MLENVVQTIAVSAFDQAFIERARERAYFASLTNVELDELEHLYEKQLAEIGGDEEHAKRLHLEPEELRCQYRDALLDDWEWRIPASRNEAPFET